MSDAHDSSEAKALDGAVPEFVLLSPDDPQVLEYVERTSSPEWDGIFDIETYRARRASSRPAS